MPPQKMEDSARVPNPTASLFFFDRIDRVVFKPVNPVNPVGGKPFQRILPGQLGTRVLLYQSAAFFHDFFFFQELFHQPVENAVDEVLAFVGGVYF